MMHARPMAREGLWVTERGMKDQDRGWDDWSFVRCSVKRDALAAAAGWLGDHTARVRRTGPEVIVSVYFEWPR